MADEKQRRDLMTIAVIGRLGKDPVAGETSDKKTPTAKFSLAVDRGRGYDSPAWFSVVCFGSLAHTAGEYLRKGRKVYVAGRFTPYQWEGKGGDLVLGLDLEARDLIFLDGPNDGDEKGDSDGKKARR